MKQQCFFEASHLDSCSCSICSYILVRYMLVHTHTTPHTYKQTCIYNQTRNASFMKSPEDSVDDGHVAIPLWLHAREATTSKRRAGHHNSSIRPHRPDAGTGAHADEGERSLEYLIPRRRRCLPQTSAVGKTSLVLLPPTIPEKMNPLHQPPSPPQHKRTSLTDRPGKAIGSKRTRRRRSQRQGIRQG